MAGELQRRSDHVLHRTDRGLDRVNREINRARRDLQTQLAKEHAAIAAVSNCAKAVESLPPSTPQGVRSMSERIARGTSRLIGRLVR